VAVSVTKAHFVRLGPLGGMPANDARKTAMAGRQVDRTEKLPLLRTKGKIN
jgi:hypothetical protein